jgi:4-methyl-5(b-hydroxyethyl)-thiazole monophosphate biosynthesis
MVYLLLAEGFEEIEALMPVDILRRAGIPVQTVGITGKTVVGSHNIPVVADILPEEMGDTELLILPGGMPGAQNLHEWEGMDALLASTLKKGGRVAAICAAPMILGLRGYLEGRHAVCYPSFRHTLKGAHLASGRVITDGPFTTSIGMGAAMEFGAELVSLLLGIDEAARIYTEALGK